MGPAELLASPHVSHGAARNLTGDHVRGSAEPDKDGEVVGNEARWRDEARRRGWKPRASLLLDNSLPSL